MVGVDNLGDGENLDKLSDIIGLDEDNLDGLSDTNDLDNLDGLSDTNDLDLDNLDGLSDTNDLDVDNLGGASDTDMGESGESDNSVGDKGSRFSCSIFNTEIPCAFLS